MHLIANTAAGELHAPAFISPMAIGKTGAVGRSQKREGDAKTPLGRYRVEHGYYRADRLTQPQCGVPLTPIKKADGWCDDPNHSHYNAHVDLPFDASRETLWRGDHLYDLVFVLSHNRWPAVPGYGSAIFLHAAREEGSGLAPTQGCLALPIQTLIALAKHLTPQTYILIR